MVFTTTITQKNNIKNDVDDNDNDIFGDASRIRSPSRICNKSRRHSHARSSRGSDSNNNNNCNSGNKGGRYYNNNNNNNNK